MKVAESRITAQGQLSVPAEIRRRLGLVPGSTLEWDDQGDQVVVRRSGRSTSDDIHRALFHEKPAPRSLEELKAGLEQSIRERHARR